MSGTIGLIATDLARYTMFTKCLLNLRAPVNTDIQWVVGTDLAHNRNRLAKAAVERGSEWIVFLDDDMVFPTDHLSKLLAWEQPIVGSLYTSRATPYRPIAYDWVSDELGWEPIDLTQLPGEGLVAIDAVGTGGALIRTEVFHKIPWPWFEKLSTGSEDLEFCKKAKAHGFPIHVDLSATMGHMTTASLWPQWLDGQWTNGFVLADGTASYLPVHGREPREGMVVEELEDGGSRSW